jgi:hypothetical protein
MSAPLRNKRGCWTCRLRRKKCDEGHPYCSTCESRAITCYGFGPKPEWMDNGEKERAVANSLKETVKHTSRRKPTTQISSQHDPVIRIAPKSLNSTVDFSSHDYGSSRRHGVIPTSNHMSSQEDRVGTFQNEPAVSMLILQKTSEILTSIRITLL